MRKTKVLISFDLPSIYVDRIRNVSTDLDVVQSKDKDSALNLAPDADILFAGFFSQELFVAAKKLKWIQAWGAGVDRLLVPQVVKSHVVVTNAGGVHPTPVSEHAIALMLCLCRKLHLCVRNQSERRWTRYESGESIEQVEELSGKTVGIVGLGRIGAELARKTKCLGMRVIATKRHLSGQQSASVDLLIRPSNLKKLLAESDFVVLTLPLTKETMGMIGEAQLKSMKQTSYLINVSRGKIIQEDKLIEALRQRWIAGAGLDTFENEPLPKNNELWSLRNVIITPHIAGLTPYYMDRVTNIFCENLNRFMRKESLVNVVDKKLGY